MIKDTINNDALFKDAKVLDKVCKPFIVAMKMADGDVPAMGKLYEQVFDGNEDLRALETAELPADCRDALVKQAEERWEYFDHPLHRAAYALDPEHQMHS